MVFLLYLVSALGIFLISITRKNYFLSHLGNFQSPKPELTFIFFCLLLFSYFFVIKKKRVITKEILIIITITIIILFITPPVFYTDVGVYLVAARNFIEFHIDPFAFSLNYVNDPWIAEIDNTYWMNAPSSYGPLFLLLTIPAVIFKIKSLLVSIYIYKVIVFGAYLSSIYIFNKLAPKNSKGLWLLFALNPAILVSLLVDVHNDVFPMFFLLLSIYLLRTKRWNKGLLAFLASILVKFNTIIYLPIFWFVKKKLSPVRVIISTLATITPLAIFITAYRSNYLPFFASINDRCIFACTPFVQLSNFLFKDNAGLFRNIVFVGVYGIIFYIFLFKRKQPLRFIFWSYLALLFISVSWLSPWYLTLIIPIGLLINRPIYQIMTFLITTYSLLRCFGIIWQ
jgi:hypothetical protein